MAESEKRAKIFLLRAQEMDAVDGVVAYYCRVWAVKILAKNRQDISPEGKTLMTDTLMKAEESKKSLNLTGGQQSMEDFAVKIFGAADQNDRNGKSTLPTAAQFYAAACFIEACSQFYSDEQIPARLATEMKYAKFRSFSIRDCIKKGLDPSPPEAMPGDDELSSALEGGTPSTSSAPAQAAPESGASLGGYPSQSPVGIANAEAAELKAKIAVAEEARKLREQLAAAEARMAASPASAPVVTPAPASTADQAAKIRAQIAHAEQAAALKAQIAAAEARKAAAAALPGLAAAAPAAMASNDTAEQLRAQIAAAEDAARRRAQAASVQVSAAQSAAAAAGPAVIQVQTYGSMAPLSPGVPNLNASDEAMATAKKKAEFAISALDFNDFACARQLVREAVQLLER